MKRFSIFLLTTILLFSGCSSSSSDSYDSSDISDEYAESTQQSDESVPSESEYISDSLNTSDPASRLDELMAEAEKMASNSSKITDGELYSSITSIYQDISLTDMNNTLSIIINLNHSSVDEDSAAFFYIARLICDSCNLENSYTGVVFSLFVDNSSVSTLTLIDYSSPTSFKSSSPIVLNDTYKESMERYYNDFFISSDISNSFDSYLYSLKNMYSISN